MHYQQIPKQALFNIIGKLMPSSNLFWVANEASELWELTFPSERLNCRVNCES